MTDNKLPQTILPWFPFYHDHFDSDLFDLSAVALGVHIRMLIASWKQGPLPSELPKLAKRCRISNEEMKRAWYELSAIWRTNFENKLVNDHLERVRTEQDEYRLKQTESGKKGAQTRWQNHKKRP